MAPYPEKFDHGDDAQCAAFAHALAAKFSTSYWPLVLAALPWITLALRAVGLESAAKATEILGKTKKGGQ